MIRIAPARKRPIDRFYVCDGKVCPKCEWHDPKGCHHTADISHARYKEHPEEGFEMRPHPDFGPQMWEKIRPGEGKKTRRRDHGDKPTL